jgi:hypothetical protein
MMNVGFGNAQSSFFCWFAAGAGTVWFNWGEIGGETGMFQVQNAGASNGVTESLGRIVSVEI